MPVVRYTCTSCGLITLVEEGQDHIACACGAAYQVEPEVAAEAETPPAEAG